MAGLLSPTLVHFMPTTLTMMPIKPNSTDTTIMARHVWMWTGSSRRRGCSGESRGEARVGGWVKDDEQEIREEEGRATKRGERGEMK